MKIVLIVLAVLFLLFLCPTSLSLYWKNELFIKIRWLFLRFSLLPQPQKKKPPFNTPEQTPESSANLAVPSKHNPSDLLTQYADMLPDLLNSLKPCVFFLLKRIRVKKLTLNLLVSREDAAETAIAYGRANQTIYTALGILQNTIRFHCRPDINIGFNYLSREEDMEMRLTVSIVPLFLVIGALMFLWNMLTHSKEMKPVNRANGKKRQTKYGGNDYGQGKH